MHPALRRSVAAPLMLVCALTCAQTREFPGAEGESPRRFDAGDLREKHIELPGQGQEIPGIDLRNLGRPRMAFTDDSAFAQRTWDDHAWPFLYEGEDSLVAGVNTWWVRYRLDPDKDLKDVPLVLSLGSTAAVEVFLNGRSILRSQAMPLLPGNTGMPLSDTLPYVNSVFTFLCDGERESIALRITGTPGTPLSANACDLSIHRPDTVYGTQRISLHFGIFVGVNLIILLLSIVLWFQDKRDKSWLLLALLALIEAFDSVMDVAGDMGLLGFPEAAERPLRTLAILLKPWPLYLLILVLRKLRGDLDRKSARRYAWAIIFLTILSAGRAAGELFGMPSVGDQLGSDVRPSPGVIALLVIVVIVLIVMCLVFVWFAVDVIRLAIRLLRTRGYERWIGGGALVSCVVTFVLVPFTDGGALGSLMGVASHYCDHVAVPVSVAIYLAIRSAHHNKAVARQRDDLDREVQERTAELSLSKKRSDDLLLNILPHEVAEELKLTGSAAAKHFDQATVMFTDFKGFTAMSERVAPGALLEELNACFRGFDDIIARHGIEKIKTIGDAYMCASGLPDPKTSSPSAVVFAALEMQAFMEARRSRREAEGQLAFVMRAGIHTGPVVAGIVGVKKFQYDIWGDTVNTASRMESSGEVGQVNISDATYALVRNETGLLFTPRGKVSVKGKADMEMYFVRAAS